MCVQKFHAIAIIKALLLARWVISVGEQKDQGIGTVAISSLYMNEWAE